MKSQPPSKYFIILTILTILVWGLVYLQDIPQNTPEQAKNATESELKTDLLVMTGNTLIAVSSPVIERMKVLAVITAYNAVPEQTDADYCISASGRNVCLYPEQVIACPPVLEFGQIVSIRGQEFICHDRMNIRFRQPGDWYFDILKPTLQEAKNFGRQKNVKVIIY